MDQLQIVFIPFMTRDLFARHVGITDDTLEGWIRNGYVKVFKIGTRSLVDMRQWTGEVPARAAGQSTGRVLS